MGGFVYTRSVVLFRVSKKERIKILFHITSTVPDFRPCSHKKKKKENQKRKEFNPDRPPKVPSSEGNSKKMALGEKKEPYGWKVAALIALKSVKSSFLSTFIRILKSELSNKPLHQKSR